MNDILDTILENDINDSTAMEIRLDTQWLQRKVKGLGYEGTIAFNGEKFTYTDAGDVTILGGRLNTAWEAVQNWAD